jgi:hypothetical protein
MESFDIPAEELRRAGAQTFFAGNDAAAKKTVSVLLDSPGIEAVDVGDGVAAFRAAEALGDEIRMLMIDGKRGGRAHLKLIALPEPTLGLIAERDKSAYVFTRLVLHWGCERIAENGSQSPTHANRSLGSS